MVISGAKNEGALCYLLEIDNQVKILLDCGWNNEFNLDDLKHLRRCAYPYAFDYFGLNYPVYATVPVIHMGRMCMYDIYQSKVNKIEFDTLALDNVDLAFERINVLKYSQPMILGGKCKGITITAYSAGHTLMELFLHSNGVVLDALSRPSLMITDAYNSLVIHPPRKLHDTALFAEQCKKQEREAAQAALIAKSLSIIEEDETDDEESEAGDADMEELLAKQFDLYVHDVIKYGGFFKQMQSYLMYPYIEKRKICDGYGEIIPPDMFKRIDGLIGNDGIGVEPIGDCNDMGGGDREELDKDSNHSSLDSNVPTKYVSYNEDVTFKCQIQFIYLEGTNDRRSLKTIVPQVQPRKLVIKYCAIPIEENTSNNNPIFVGEVKLSELKCLLQSEGITAEFKGEGVLVCNEKVTIKKTSIG
nr:566_t:CDS:2 [Entrophospora candida]